MKKRYSTPDMGIYVIETAPHMVAATAPAVTSNTKADPNLGGDAKRRRGIFDEDSEPEGSIW